MRDAKTGRERSVRKTVTVTRLADGETPSILGCVGVGVGVGTAVVAVAAVAVKTDMTKNASAPARDAHAPIAHVLALRVERIMSVV